MTTTKKTPTVTQTLQTTKRMTMTMTKKKPTLTPSNLKTSNVSIANKKDTSPETARNLPASTPSKSKTSPVTTVNKKDTSLRTVNRKRLPEKANSRKDDFPGKPKTFTLTFDISTTTPRTNLPSYLKNRVFN